MGGFEDVISISSGNLRHHVMNILSCAIFLVVQIEFSSVQASFPAHVMINNIGISMFGTIFLHVHVYHLM